MMNRNKLSTGIAGFDELSGGGLPVGRVSLVAGGAGCGKTIFALQSAVLGGKPGERSVFVCFEENRKNLVGNARAFDWDLDAALDDSLHIVEAHMSPNYSRSGTFDVEGLLAIVEAKVRETGATRVIFDAVDVLIGLLGDRAAERHEFHRIHEWLQKNGLTGMLTAKSRSGASPDVDSEFDYLQYMVDCVVVLHHRFVDRTSMRSLRILKYRGSSHNADEFPMVITGKGISVSDVTPQLLDHAVSTERVSSGITRLDTMLGGGYYRGSSILVSGSPGTAKTTLAGCFIDAACKRKEQALFISFDESGDQILRNLLSIGIDLRPYVEKGRLKMASFRTGSVSAEEHYLAIRRLVNEVAPASMVVDPISALSRAGGQIRASSVVLRIVDYAKSLGITALLTSLLEHNGQDIEETRADVSTMADTWMQLSFAVLGGERNRALTIIKSRGMHHSNQVRELVLSDKGPTLADVYVAGGEVLMGTARVEREREIEKQERNYQNEMMRRRLELEAEQANLKQQLHEIENQLQLRSRLLDELKENEQNRQNELDREREEIRQQRYADRDKRKSKQAIKKKKTKRAS